MCRCKPPTGCATGARPTGACTGSSTHASPRSGGHPARTPPALPAAVAPPVALPPRPAAITATEKPAGGSSPASSTGRWRTAGAAAPTAPAPSGSRGLNLHYPTSMLRGPPRQKSAAELANEQLNGDGSRNRLGEAVDAATRPDCFGKEAGATLGVLAPIVGVVQAVRDKCK